MKNEYIKIKKEIVEQLEILKPEKGLKNIERFKRNYLWALNNVKPKMHVSIGNAKLPKEILIFNLGTWFNCSGRKEKFCDICKECYDKSPEVRFKNRILGRLEQEIWWRNTAPEKIAKHLIKFIITWNKHHKIKIKYIRFNEVGELRNQKDLNKVIKISNIIGQKLDIYSYIYTHNKNLNFNIDRPYLTINGSNFMVDNEFRVLPKKQIKPIQKGNIKHCICDCDKCTKYCLYKNKNIIIETLRG